MLDFSQRHSDIVFSSLIELNLSEKKSTTFSESSGREASHGGTLDMCFNIKISSNLLKSKNSPFLAILSDTLQKKFRKF